MKRWALSVIASLAILVGILGVVPRSLYAIDVDSLVQKYVQALNAKDYQEAALVLHYPETFVAEKLEKERNDVASALSIFADELGEVVGYRRPAIGQYLHLGVQAGSGKHWAKHPPTTQVVYEVDYSRAGNGFIIFQFSQVHGKLVVYSVLYGLPENDPNTILALNRIAT